MEFEITSTSSCCIWKYLEHHEIAQLWCETCSTSYIPVTVLVPFMTIHYGQGVFTILICCYHIFRLGNPVSKLLNILTYSFLNIDTLIIAYRLHFIILWVPWTIAWYITFLKNRLKYSLCFVINSSYQSGSIDTKVLNKYKYMCQLPYVS